MGGRIVIICALAISCLLWSPGVVSAQTDRLAVFNFRATNIQAMGPNIEILYALIPDLEQLKSIKLMPRRQMEEALHQAGLAQSDDPDRVLEAGKKLKVNFILFGQVTQKESQIIAQFKLMDIENAVVLQTWDKALSGREDILKQMPLLAQDLDAIIKNRDKFLPAASPPPPTPPQQKIAVENFQARDKTHAVVITWKFDPQLPVAEFNVYRSQKPEGPYRFVGKTRKNVFNDTTIRKGQSYCYRLGITLHSGKEISTQKIVRIATAGAKLPYPPVIIGASGYIRRTVIKFVPSLLNQQKNFKITEYKIYRRQAPEQDWHNIKTLRVKSKTDSKLTFTIEDAENLEDGQTYVYALTSLDKKKRESLLSDPVTVKINAPPALQVETRHLLRNIPLSWPPMENVKGYHIYRKSDARNWKKIATLRGADKNRFVDQQNMMDGKEYRYYLTAFDSKLESGPSNTVKTKTKDLPPVPEAFQTQSGLVKSVKISWQPIEDSDIGGYAIYRSMDGRNFERIAKAKGHRKNDYLDKGKILAPLTDGQNYYYAIAGFNLFGAEGPRSPVAIARTKPKPGICHGLKAAAATDHIFLEWKPNPEKDIKSYILYRSKNDGSWSKITHLDASRTRYRDSDLKPDITYRYQIVVEDLDGLKSEPAESVAVESPIATTKN